MINYLKIISEHEQLYGKSDGYTFFNQMGTSSSQVDYSMASENLLLTNFPIGDKDNLKPSSYVHIWLCELTKTFISGQNNYISSVIICIDIYIRLYYTMSYKILKPVSQSTEERLGEVGCNYAYSSKTSLPIKTLRLKGPSWKASPEVKVVLIEYNQS